MTVLINCEVNRTWSLS